MVGRGAGLELVDEIGEAGFEELGADGSLRLVQGARGAELDDGPVVGVEGVFREKVGGEGEVAAVEKQDGARVDRDHEFLHVGRGGWGQLSGGGNRQRGRFGVPDERRDFRAGQEVPAP